MWHDDDDDNESSWKVYAAACRNNITTEFIERLKEEDRLEVESANRDYKVFTAPVGGDQILWEWKYNMLFPASSLDRGWRENPDGTREEVVYYGGEWGWLSLSERFDARQKHPRTAP